MKHFMDIENARFEDIDLGGGIVRRSNTGAFHVGDKIVIQEKFDGSCASIQYDAEQQKYRVFSRKKELSFSDTLEGFFHYITGREIAPTDPALVIFGEWGRKNKIVYNKESYKVWYVFDIYDTEKEEYLPQTDVRTFCDKYGFTYINTLYEGEFISWEHVKSFLNSPAYGDRQEGVVCKNQSLLSDKENRLPFYLKIVNEDFKETMKQRIKEVDPEKELQKANAEQLISGIVTENRVRKMIEKLVDEGILKKELTPADMGIVAKNLPNRIYEDCMKEEKEVMQRAGEYAGKSCSSITMQIARKIILG